MPAVGGSERVKWTSLMTFMYHMATQAYQGLHPAFLHALPKLHLGWASSHHKEEASCI